MVDFIDDSTKDFKVKFGVEMSYDPGDPFAVKARFPNGVEWLFARDLLEEGLVTTSGVGDIRFTPCHSHIECVHIELESPDGSAFMKANAWELAEFIERTYDLVPLGTESSRIDFDLEIERLVSG
ncbi:SsgA family sporulation/cell division regulator [Amycolatopsis oliviviridis]|nr:SsgA family sporulation/cell division regulator [Amycolatopsis oliviviridis]